MNDKSENEEPNKQNDVPLTKSISPSHKYNENKDNEAVFNSFSSEHISGEIILAESSGQMMPDLVPNHTEENQKNHSEVLSNETSNQTEGSCCKVLANENTESNKRKTFKLPTESEAGISSSKHEIVGDDFSKRSEINIVCECEPNVAGAAVPTVTSFIPNESKDVETRCNNSGGNVSEKTDIPQTYRHVPVPLKNTNLTSKMEHEFSEEETINLDSRNKKFKCNQQENKCIKPNLEKKYSDMKSYPKKPSLIPKLARLTSGSGKNLDNAKEEVEKPNTIHSHPKSDSPKCSLKTTNNGVKIKDTKTVQISKYNKRNNVTLEKHLENKGASSNTNTISSRMLGLQERLKATTSMLRQKIDMDKGKEKVEPNGNTNFPAEEVIEEDTSPSNKITIDDLYKSISHLKDVASILSEHNTLKGQTKYFEKMFSNISDIKLLADKLCLHDRSYSKQNMLDDSNGSMEKEKATKSSAVNAKDNKIYIKFIHAKDRKIENKKKKKDVSPEQSEEVQIDVALDSKLTSDSLNSKTCVTEKNKEENKLKETDSMDGVFIPSFEPPINMEDEEETNGLDITITFPEFSQLYANGAESHLSVCLSDISAEALKRLKRCPKDFTLRMDFVEGKVQFQSGKGPANNFQIGPDLKFSENIIDTKKSDVISIKRSTECSFASQLIPVEDPKEIKSFKSLKSTDSELFNVVSLPFMYKNPYLATSHKSCITFRNDQIMSMAILAKHIFKSMPQIPSLTNIFEDKMMDSPSKTDSRETTQKSTESKKVD